MTRLIVIEGLDGAGTTTQAKRLVEHLTSRGHQAHATREPSDGPIGRLIREMLTGSHAIADQSIAQSTVRPPVRRRSPRSLAARGRAEARRRVPVVSDRWYHSSLAYQGTGADRDWITMLNARARRPDLTIFLQVRPEVAAQRRVAAGRVQELFEDLQTQQDVDAGYRATIAELTAQGERIEVIDGEMPADNVFHQILLLAGDALSP